MQQNKPTYKLLRILILLWMPLFSQAQDSYNELPDSTRTIIRIRSHLLVQQKDLSEEFINRINKQVPLAFVIESDLKTNQVALLKKILINQKLIPLIIKERTSIFEEEMEGLVNTSIEELDIFSLNNKEDIDSIDHRKFSTNELLLLKLKAETLAYDSIIIKLWEQTGMLPNFIQIEGQKPEEALELINQLNTRRKIFGVVKSENQLLPDVSWKEYIDRKTNGYFCFPIPIEQTTQTFLTPYKAGYQFSPDIIMDSSSNRDQPKEFKALKLSADYELNSHYQFNHKIENRGSLNKNDILNYNVEFANSDTIGPVAYFSNGAYIDGGLESQSILKSNFSITIWIKPTQINLNSILGKGRNFVLKIQKGVLTYTMQGIKDYSAKNAEIPVNQWTFISLVHSAYENQMRFYLNGELVDQVRLINKYEESNYNLLIGSNLWEEFFEGYIGEIKIWERELNDNEILEQFTLSTNTKEKNKSKQNILFAALIITIGFLFIFLLKALRKKSKKKIKFKKEETTRKKSGTTNTNAEKIHCFGGLQVINQEGINVAQKFSPKLKQLFVLIFLHSINGQQGISSAKLSGYLWPGIAPKNAKNTRGTNMQKLKAALDPCSEIKLAFKDKLWFLEMTESCYSDYSVALEKLQALQDNDKGSIDVELSHLISILKRGTLLPNMTESWIDPYISSMSDQIIELGLKLFNELDEEKNVSLLYELAEVISINDPLNEPALQKKLSLLTRQGKLGLARSVYDNFRKLYFELYQEDYQVDFKTITHSIPNK